MTEWKDDLPLPYLHLECEVPPEEPDEPLCADDEIFMWQYGRPGERTPNAIIQNDNAFEAR